MAICLAFLCFGIVTAKADTFNFTTGLNAYDAVPSGTSYGPAPQFKFTNFYYIDGANGSLSGTGEFFSDERWNGSDYTEFTTNGGSEVSIVSIKIAYWTADTMETPDTKVRIEGFKDGVETQEIAQQTLTSSLVTKTLNWSDIDKIRFTGVDTGGTEFQLEVDDLVIATAPAANDDGTLTASGTVSEPVALPTTADSTGEAVDLFDFAITDGGGGDGLALTVSQIIVHVSGTSTDAERGKVTWRLNGLDASNVTGTYSAGADTITFSGLSISVADSGSETYTVNGYYNNNTGLTEDKTFILSVDGDTDLTVGGGDTQMAATSAVTNGTGTTVDITATQLVFTTQPTGSVSGSALTTQPVVAARDAFGNTDTDFTETITLTEGSAGSLSNNTQAASSGVATFTNLTYTATADQQSFTLTANDQDGAGSNLPTADSNSVTSDVVATQLAFTTQPAGSVSGSALTTQPVVTARDGNGVTDTGFTETITLTEGSAGTLSNNTKAASSGVATFTDLTYTATADQQSFTLTANDEDGTGTDLSTVNANAVISDVVATKLVFTTQPSPLSCTSGSALDFTTDPVVEARDANDVKDTGFTDQVTLLETGSGSATYANNTATASAGVATFTGLTVTYTATADQQTFGLQADDQAGGAEGDITTLPTSSSITADVVATKLVFTTQPSPLSCTSGSVLDFNTDPVVEARDANDVKDTGFTDQVTLLETGSGSATYANNTATASAGVATFTGLTVTYTATADQQTFGLEADDQTGGAEGNITNLPTSSNITADVVATKLVFTTQPSPLSCTSGSVLDFSTDPVVEARDTNDVKDTGFTDQVTLLETGSGSATYANNTATATAGVATFTGLTVTYTATADGQTFGLEADDQTGGAEGNITNLPTSSNITADVVATQLVFTTQPAGSASGSVLTTQPVVTAQDGNGVTDTGFTETVTLTEASAGSLSGDVDIAAVGGMATFTDVAYTATADQQSFTLTANDEDGTGTDLSTVDANAVTSDVVATQLAFTTQPAGSVSGSALTTQPVVTARDGNGVTDTGFTETITLTEGSAGTLSNNTKAASSGVATFTDVTYTATADQQSFTLTANDEDGTGTNLSTVNANAVTSDVVGTKLVFTTQPSPLSCTSGSVLDFTTDPVVEARDTNNVKDTGFTDQVTLLETGAGSATYANNTATATAGVATFTGLTVTYTATADGQTFGLEADDQAGGAEGDITNLPTSSSITADVVATQLVFTTQPAGSVSGVALTTQPVVTARDATGITDTGFTETITLTEDSAGSLSGDVDIAAVSGVATFTDVAYTATADQESFTLTANDEDGTGTNLSTVNATAVTSDVVATKLVFQTEPAPNTVQSGLATDLTTDPVVRAADAGDLTDTGYSASITLSEVNGAGAAAMSCTGDTDGSGGTVTVTPSSGVATFSNLQITYTASGGSDENFNLRADSGGLTTADSVQFTGYIPPAITSATYNAATGVLVVTCTNLEANGGSDIDASDLTFTGEGSDTHALTDTADVNIDSGTQFTVTLSATDKAEVNQILNKDGATSTGGATYNLAAADDWNTAVTEGDTSDTTGNGITVSSVPAPTITSSTYDAGNGALVVTGTGLLKRSGATNDIDVSKLTFKGEGGATYALTDTADVEIDSGIQFTVTLSATDKTEVNLLLNKEGTSSLDSTTYNLAAADNWAAGADAAVNVADLTGNGITVSNISDSDGSLTAAGTVSEPVPLPTTAASAGEAVDLFDFTIGDGGGGDGLALTVSQIVVHVSGTSTDAERGKITWRLNGTNVSNVEGTYSAGADTVTFSGLSISVADDGDETYTINGFYNNNTGLTEDTTFILSVDGDTDVTVGSGTRMDVTSAMTNGTGTTVDVTATQLAFTTQPAGSVSGTALTTQPVVDAQDAVGNTDTDFTETVTLTEASAGSLSGDVDITAVDGVATFTDVAYTATADQQSFTLTANDEDSTGTNLSTVDANAVTSDVVATQLAFTTQPAGSVSGSALTTQPVVAAQDGNGVTDTGFTETVTLTEGSDGSLSGDVDIAAVGGVATFTDVTYTATADQQSFILTGNDEDGTGTDISTVNANAVTSDVVATKLAFTTQPSPLSCTSGAVLNFTTDPVVEARDANNVKDTGFTDQVTLLETGIGTAVYANNTATASAGVATFTGLTVTYSATADGQTFGLQADDQAGGAEGDITNLPTSSAITADVVATQLVFTTQPAGSISGSALTTQPVVTARDAAGITDTGFTETVTLAEGSDGSLSGDVDIAAVSGVTTFTDVAYSATADQQSFTLTANDEDGTGTDLSTVNANAVTSDVVATLLVFSTQPAGSVSGSALTTQPVVAARNAAGIADTDFTETVTLTEGSAGDLTNNTKAAISGVATFADLTYTATADQESFTLTANDEDGTGTDLSTTNADPVTSDVVATQLVFTTQPAGSVSGSALTTQPVVAARDAAGITDTGFTETITLTEGSDGSLSNNTKAAASGVATFTDLTYTATTDQESFTLTANDEDGAGTDLSTVNANAVTSDVVATQLVFTTQPAGSVSGSALTTQPVVTAQNAGGITDTGFTEIITLTEGSDGDLTNNTKAAVAGVATFTDLTYTATADQQSFTLTANDEDGAGTDLSTVNADPVTSDVVATLLAFTTQPAGSVSGAALTTQPMVTARDGNGVTDTGFTETITLTEASDGTLSNNTKAAVAGVATFTDLTYTATADQESFTLTANDEDATGTDLSTVTANAVTADVVATQLAFTTQPVSSVSGSALTTQPVVTAQDGNGVTDIGFTETVTLTEGSDGSLSGDVDIAAVAGVATFTDVVYTATADQQSFTLTANDEDSTGTDLSTVNANAVTSDVVATQLVFTTQPSPLSCTSGAVLDFTTDPVVEARDGNDVKDTGFTDQVTLTETGDGTAAYANNTATASAGVATFTGLTVTYTATADQQTFGLQADDQSGGAEGDITNLPTSSNITADVVATQLVFTTQPAGSISGSALTTQPVVTARDAAGITDTGFTETITLTEDSDGSLSGDVDIAAVSGVATFTDVAYTATADQQSFTLTANDEDGVDTDISTVNANAVTADVVTTQLVFTTQPAGSVSGSALTTQPVVEARDGNGVTDTGFTETITLSEASAGTLSNYTATASSGVATFTDLTYTATADQQSFTLTANDEDGTGTDLSTVYADPVTSDVVATKLVFITQPSPLSCTSGSALDFTTDPVVEARDANDVKDTGFTDQVTLTETGAGTAAYANNTATAVAGVATFTGLTVTYTATVDQQTFGLQADDETGGAEGDLTDLSTSSATTADVVATQLAFTTQPAGSVSDSALTTQPVITARDAAGITDTDFTETITLTEESAGGLSNNTQAAVAGVATFTDLTYTATADQESFTLTANDEDGTDTDLSTVNAGPVTSDVVATRLVFQTEPAPTFIQCELATGFTTSPVVRAADGGGLTDTGYSTAVTLSEANGAGTAALSCTGDTDGSGDTVTVTPSSGVATFADLLITYTAAGNADENFNLLAGSGALTAADSTQLTACIPPVVDLDDASGGTGYSGSFVEADHQGAGNGDGEPITNNPVITNNVGDSLTQVLVTLDDSQGDTGERIFLSGTFTNVSYTLDSADQITITNAGGATLAQMAAALAAVRFQNDSDAPDTTDRTITVQVIDATGSTSSTTTVSVTSSNDNPVITSDGGNPTASVNTDENQTAVTTVTATDVDLPVQTLTFSITGGADSAKFSVDGSSGVLTFQSSPDYEVAADSDTNNDYMVEVTVTDDGTGNLTDVQTITVNVQDVNDPPVLAGIETAVHTFINGMDPITVTSTLTVTDVDDTALDGATVEITGNYLADQDVLSFDDTASITVDVGKSSNGLLVLTGTGTPSQWQAALQTVTYENTAALPDESPRTVTFTVTDGDDGSNSVSRDITVIADIWPPEIVSMEVFDDDLEGEDGYGYLDRVVFTFNEPLKEGEEDIGDWVLYDADGVTNLLAGLDDSAITIDGDTVTIVLADSGGTAGTPFYMYSEDGDGGAIGDPYGNDVETVSTNTAPVAEAGTPIETLPRLVRLNASGSTDSDGNVLTYSWTQDDGPIDLGISGAEFEEVAFAGRAKGTYTFTLTAADPFDTEDEDTVSVTILNGKPVAKPGRNRALNKDDDTDLDVVLVGCASRDPNSYTGYNDIVDYQWRWSAGPQEVELTQDETVPTLSVHPKTAEPVTRAGFDSSVLVAGAYTFSLTVTDADGLTGEASVEITVNDPDGNRLPVADAGIGMQQKIGSRILLDGHESKDSDGDKLSYRWEQVSGPSVKILRSTKVKAMVRPSKPGTYVFRLIVNDGQADSAPATVTVEMTDPRKLLPVAEIMVEGVVRETWQFAVGEEVTLKGTVLGMDEGDVTPAWSQVRGTTLTIDNPAVWDLLLSPVEEGVYTFRLDVSADDSTGRCKEIIVTVLGDSVPPVADAGPDQLEIMTGNLVTLDATGSYDDDPGDILDHTWTQLLGPAVQLSDPYVVQPTFTPQDTGACLFQLIVFDGDYESAPDLVWIVIHSEEEHVPTAKVVEDSITDGVVNRTVIMNGTPSSDPDSQDTLVYQWVQTGGAMVVLDDPYSSVPSFTPAFAGTYLFSLYVDDSRDRSIGQTVTVTVGPAGAVEPGNRETGGPNCFIATAAYGTPFENDVVTLRTFRDDVLLPTEAGTKLVDLYYRYSPPVADVIRGNESLRRLVRTVLSPAVRVIELTE